jgi:ABC-type dipeptide/oligopeptide/nickel transport system permease component
MTRLILRRFIFTLVVLIGVTIIAFVLVRLAPGDPARLMMGITADSAGVEAMREKMGLNKPLIVQYFTYLRGIIQGDFGYSFYYRKPCLDLILARLPATLQLTGYGLFFIILLGIPLGLISGIKKGSVIDTVSMFIALIGQSMSPVWLCLLMILVFGVILHLLPTQGMGSLKYAVMPSICTAFGFYSLVTRMLRSSMTEVLQEDYITAIRARGIGKMQVYLKYAFKNALLPIVTVLGSQVGIMMAGSMVIESIFSWPGLGLLTVDAISLRDFQLIQSILLISAFIYILCNLIVDLLYTFIDKRIAFN